MFTIDDMTAPATEEEYMTAIDGKPFDLRQVKRVTWKGAKNVVAFHNADSWVLKLKDGNKVEVNPKELDYNAHYWLTEITYP